MTTSTTTSSRRDRALRRTAATAALAALALLPAGLPASARAEVPVGTPTFPTPLAIDNAFLPVVPGAMKVFGGRDGRQSVVIVERHLNETRTFTWGDEVVECRVVEETKFVAGQLVAREQVFLAQAGDGSVWTFGEIEDDDPDDDGGDDANEPGGWVVGQVAPGDPVDAVSAAAPSLRMPATPQRGDTWLSENVAPHFVSVARVQSDEAALRGSARRSAARRGLRVHVNDTADGSAETEWYAEGFGRVQARAPGESLVLRASTLRRRTR